MIFGERGKMIAKVFLNHTNLIHSFLQKVKEVPHGKNQIPYGNFGNSALRRDCRLPGERGAGCSR
jgi:hypothetical protein